MLQNMGHSCSIWGIRLEPYTEDIVWIFPCNMQVVGIRFVMPQQHRRQMQLWDMFLFLHSETMPGSSNTREVLQIRYRRSGPLLSKGPRVSG